MAVNADLARIFGGDADAVYLAPIGTTMPTTIDGALDPDFEDTGWLNEDGINEVLSGSKELVRGHQGGGVVRSRMSEPGTSFEFSGLEDKALTRELRYDVKTATTAAGVRSETRRPGQKISRRSCVIDFFDADDDTIKERWIIPRVEIAPNGDRAYTNADIAAFPFSAEIIGEYTVLSTDLENPGE